MGDTIAFCSTCLSPTPGLCVKEYRAMLKAAVEKKLKADGIIASRPANDIAVSADVDLGNNMRDIMDDLGVLSECCRISLMSFAYQPVIGEGGQM